MRPVPFLYPLQHRGWERLYAGSGVALYDALSRLSGRAGVPLHQHLTRRGAPQAGAVAAQGRAGRRAARTTTRRSTTPGTPCSCRAPPPPTARTSATRARVVELLQEGERVTGAVVHDLESGTTITIRARQVINATGVWTDETQSLGRQRGQFHVRASKGVHLVVPKDRIRSEVGLILRTEKSVLFVIPWGRHWIIGTTDTDWDARQGAPGGQRGRHRLPARPRQRGARGRR